HRVADGDLAVTSQGDVAVAAHAYDGRAQDAEMAQTATSFRSGPGVGLVVQLLQALDRRMSIHLCRAQRGVAQQLLNGAQVGSGVEQVRGERVPQRVHVQLPPARQPSEQRL